MMCCPAARAWLVRLSTLVALVAAVAIGTIWNPGYAQEKGKKNRLFELRTYTTHDGKLNDLHKRFRDHTNKLFEKHGMTLIAYWTPTDKELSQNTLVYVLAFPDRKARDASFEGFRTDPDWQRAFRASRANGPIVKKVVSQFLTPTDYSPMK